MNFRFVAFLVLFALSLGAGAFAQEEASGGLEATESGQDYQRSIRLRGIENDVRYFDPTQPAPPLETREQPPEEQAANETDGLDNSSSQGTTGERVMTLIISAAVIGGIVYLIVQYGGAMSVNFSRNPENLSRDGQRRNVDVLDNDKPLSNLDEILQMSDRKAALIALSRLVLNRVIEAQGILVQRSWTARDALRRVPRDFSHREALTKLIRDSERVQFGGRDISQSEFDAHVDSTRSLAGGGQA